MIRITMTVPEMADRLRRRISKLCDKWAVHAGPYFCRNNSRDALSNQLA